MKKTEAYSVFDTFIDYNTFNTELNYSNKWRLKVAVNIKCQNSERSFEPDHDKTNKITCAPNEDSDQPGHPLNALNGKPRLI